MTIRVLGAPREALPAAILAAILFTLVVAFLGSGCTTRERSNPLDPRNTQTQGLLTGFNAIAADSVVEFRWPALSLEGVQGYRVQRWKPGETPRNLGSADYRPEASSGEDRGVTNDSTYVYRLVAHLANGDSAVSPADTATPGARRILFLEAGTPAFSRLSPDARDVLYVRVVREAYADMELDRKHEVLWLADEGSSLVIRKAFDGATVGAALVVTGPWDLSVSNTRGVGWVASPGDQRVISFGPDIDDPLPQRTINAVGHPRVVEAGTLDPTVWVGSEEGKVYRFRAQDAVLTREWMLSSGSIRAIALDETVGAAWVATQSDGLSDLFYLDPAAGDSMRVRTGLLNVADLAVDPTTGDLWVSERGAPRLNAGRLSLITRSGTTLMSLTGLEPYGIDPEPVDGTCWVTDLHSNRVLNIDRSGAVLRSSPDLQTPYAVRLWTP